MPLRRVLWILAALLLVAGVYTGWLAWQVKGDLEAARAGAQDLRSALRADDTAAADEALADLRGAAAAADGRTDGFWWSAMAWAPLVGDDAEGARALSASLHVLAEDGAEPLIRIYEQADGLTRRGRIDLALMDRIAPDVAEAGGAFDRAAALVEGLDSSGYAGPVRARFDEYVDVVTVADRTLASADTALDVLPGMLGADGPRDYLLLFENNAEVRATGGMPGSWAQLHADGGRLSLVRQGSAGDFPVKPRPVVPLTEAEKDIYDEPYGIYFQDVGFAPDFPRAAELAHAHWRARFPGTPLDGVIGIDPVAMGYLLAGTGPVTVGDRELTADNAVDELLSRPYLELEPQAQDELFVAAARAVFDAATSDLADPIEFGSGLAKAAREGRLHVAPFTAAEAKRLEGSTVEGALAGDDGATPHVDIGVNDATGSKMSYYLRYQATVRATGCSGDRQELMASMSLNQAIDPGRAAALPESVTGPGTYTVDQGDQLVLLRVYGPYGGTIEDIRMDGKALDPEPVDDRGRPVVTLVVQLSDTDDVDINWSMTTGPGQTGDGWLGMTPSVTPGGKSGSFSSAC